MSDHVFRINDFDIMRQFDIASTNRAFTFLKKVEVNHITIVQLENDTLEIQKDVYDIFLNTVNGGVLMEHTLNTDFGRRVTGHR
jgi:hypothetical protein